MVANGSTLKQLRVRAGISLAGMVRELMARGVNITTRPGVCHIERRGARQYLILKTYAEVAGVDIAEVSRPVA